ncbi:MAG TPA: shikimate kinase [Candidatus Udaeobacter sp.]|nr:shikimate kinase [Candidatus Udaeobacter sp.]
MGSGKSVVGSIVAQRAGAPFFDLDLMVEDKAGMSIAEIFATRGEEAFRGFERETLPLVLVPGAVAALGGGVVMDDANWRLISIRATTVYLEVPFETIWQRIRHLTGRPLILDRTPAEVEALYERRRPRYEEAAHKVDGTRDASVVADEVLKLWSA